MAKIKNIQGVLSATDVSLMDAMGNDLTVVNAARVSFHKEVSDMEPRDAKLINYLAKHKHWTPFSQVQLQFRIRMPIFVARQWFKHQVGFTRNEVSRRYVDELPQLFPFELRARPDASIKQGSGEPIRNPELRYAIQRHCQDALDLYQRAIESGVAPECARAMLPQNMYTEFVETGSLAAYARLVSQRTDPTAQKEIRQYAELISMNAERVAPISWKALTGNE